MLIIWFSVGAEAGASVIGGTLLNMAVAGAMLAYFMQGMSYIVLKKKFPHLHRPYNEPVRHRGRGDLHGHRGGDALLPAHRPGVPGGGHRRRRSTMRS